MATNQNESDKSDNSGATKKTGGKKTKQSTADGSANRADQTPTPDDTDVLSMIQRSMGKEQIEEKPVPAAEVKDTQATVSQRDIYSDVEVFLENFYGPDSSEQLSEAKEFWRTVLSTSTGAVAEILTRFVAIMPSAARATVKSGDESTGLDTFRAILPDARQPQVSPPESISSPTSTAVPPRRSKKTKSADRPPARPTASASAPVQTTGQPPAELVNIQSSLAARKGSPLGSGILEQGRLLGNAIAEMFGENPLLYEGGVPGDTVEVQLKLRRVVDKIKERPELIVLLMRTLIPLTLRRLTREGDLSPELAVDIITLTIGDLRPKRQPELQDSEMLQFFAAARALLERQKSVGFTASDRGGYYATRNAIAQYMSSGRPSNRVLKVAVFYFEEILFEYYRQMSDDKDFRLAKRDRRSLEVAGNNCGNHLDDLRVAGSDEKIINSMWALISGITVAVAVAENRDEIAGLEFETISRYLTTCFDLPDANTLDRGTLVAVDVMMYGPGAWRSEFDREQMLGLMLSAGLIRLARPSRHEDAVSPIFNAGVELLRVGEQLGDTRRLVWQRILTNAVGLWWSLKLNPDLRAALTKFHGLDCVVNLWGSISDAKVELQSKDSEFYTYCLRLYHWTKVATTKAPEKLADLERIRRSFAILGSMFDETAAHQVSMADGFALLERLCEYAIGQFSKRAPTGLSKGNADDPREHALRTTAGYFSLIFGSLDKPQLDFKTVAERVQRFVPKENKTEELILERMREIWGRATELSAESSVLAKAGIVGRDEFNLMQRESRRDELVDDYAFVAECEFSWLQI